MIIHEFERWGLIRADGTFFALTFDNKGAARAAIKGLEGRPTMRYYPVKLKGKWIMREGDDQELAVEQGMGRNK